jgi:hypothetical protein
LNDTVTENAAERRAARLGLWLVLSNMVAAVLLAGLLALWIGDSRRVAVARAQDNVTHVARMLAGNIHGEIARVDLGLQSLVTAHARAAARGFAPDGPLAVALADMRKAMPETDALLATDAGGTVRLGQAPGAPPVQLGDRDFFIAARGADGAAPVLSEPWIGRVSGKWVLSVARALRTADGRFAGVVHANLSSARFASRFATNIDLGQEGAIALRTGKLALVARLTPQGVATEGLGSSNVSPQLKAALAANPLSGAYLARTALDGVERASAYQRVEGYDLYVLVGSGTDEFPSQLTWPQSASQNASMSTP